MHATMNDLQPFSFNATGVRVPTRRKKAFNLENASTIGEKSGVGWQKQELASPRFDSLPNLNSPMGTQVIQNHDLSRLQTRCQNPFNVDFKGGAIRRPLKNERFAHAPLGRAQPEG
jgi:hypothetical protein